jgi:AI-2 transport protein TqsA
MDRPTSLFPPSTRTFLARVRNPLWSGAALVVVIYGLKEAQGVLLPITVAGLLAVICSPAVRWLEARRVPNVIAVLLVVAGLMGLFVVMGALIGGSVSGFREAIPDYLFRLESMVAATTAWLHAKGVRVDSAHLTTIIEPGKAASQAMNLVSSSMNALVSALSNTFLVVLTMILILMEGATVPAKLRAIYGDPEADISHFTQMASRVQSYLAIKTILSIVTGLLIGIWAAILDVDFPILWGLIAFLLNYIPNIGSILAAIPAMLLALVQHGVGNSLALGGGYVVVNMVIGNVIEPMWMGRKLGLSTTVVFIALAIWYEIWGPVGMLLSVPLTMIIKIMLEHSREGQSVAILLDTGESLMAKDPEIAASMRPSSAPPRSSHSHLDSSPPTPRSPPHVPSEHDAPDSDDAPESDATPESDVATDRNPATAAEPDDGSDRA